MPDKPLLLRSGVNFTNRAELKYARSVHLVNELRGRIDEWSAAETLFTRVNQVDPHTVELRLVIRREPPIDEWSLILGDALHNLRSVLDTLIWAVATLDGREPNTPSQVAFPLTDSETDWNNSVRTLESIPEEVLARIRLLQPWVQGVKRDDSMIWLLHRFDIVDKHRGLISGAIHFRQLSLGGFDLRLDPVAPISEVSHTITMREQPTRLEHDAVLATFHSDVNTLNPDPSYLGKVWVQFALATDDGRHVLIDSFLSDVIARTREWIDLICAGEVHAKALKEARDSSGTNAIYGFTNEEGEQVITQIPFAPAKEGS